MNNKNKNNEDRRALRWTILRGTQQMRRCQTAVGDGYDHEVALGTEDLIIDFKAGSTENGNGLNLARQVKLSIDIKYQC